MMNLLILWPRTTYLDATILRHYSPLLAQNNVKAPLVPEMRGNQDMQLVRQQIFATNKGIFTRVRLPSPSPWIINHLRSSAEKVQ
jgi:hypothetical protein